MRRSPDKIRQEELLAKIPPGTTRVYVCTEIGKLKYKDIDQLADSDEIQVNGSGDPIVMKGKPGRKKNINIAPINSTVTEILKRKQVSLQTDAVLQVAKSDPESPNVLHQVVLALGEEAASINFERQEAERKGEDTTQISGKRIQALKAMADTWLKRKEQLVTRGVDIDSPAFKALFKYIVETMMQSMESTGVRAEMIETIFAKFGKTVDTAEWAAEAKNRMKNMV